MMMGENTQKNIRLIAAYGFGLLVIGLLVTVLFRQLITTPGSRTAMELNAVAGGHYGCSLWYFYGSNRDDMFAIGKLGDSPRASLSRGVYYNPFTMDAPTVTPPFSISYGDVAVQVRHDLDAGTVTIGHQTFHLSSGRVFLAVHREDGIQFRQFSVEIDQRSFRKSRYPGFELLDQVDESLRLLPESERNSLRFSVPSVGAVDSEQ